MKTITPKIKVGDILTLELIDRPGQMPFAKTDTGIVCFIAKQQKKQWYIPESKWSCEVKEVKDRCLIVDPLIELVSAIENQYEKQKMIKEMTSQYSKNQERKPKAKKSFPFQSKVELRKNQL